MERQNKTIYRLQVEIPRHKNYLAESNFIARSVDKDELKGIDFICTEEIIGKVGMTITVVDVPRQ